MSNQKLILALAAYAAIALSANFTIDKLEIRYAVWVLMGGLALKTLVASQQLRAQHAAQTAERSGPDEVDPHEQQDGQPK